MGIMDMFQEAGSSLLNAITPTKKPGEFCLNECNINDIRCEACLAEQDKIRAAVNEWQSLAAAIENAANDPQAAEKNRITKCSLCGAPIEKSEQSCPYCGEPYPAGAVTADMPESKTEQDNMLLQKASEIYDMYAVLKKRINANRGNDMKEKLPSFIGGAATTLYTASNRFVDMSPQDIKKLAKQNGVSYCDYVVGVMQGTYQSAGTINLMNQLQLINNMIPESSPQQTNFAERSRQIEAERQAKLKATRDERHKLEMEMIKMRRAPQYSGGGGGGSSSKCCGNCKHFIAADTRCAIHNHWQPSSASDDCNQYVPK